MTKDIDALYEPEEIINKLASQIADSENLPSDWLNDSVKGFVGSNAPIVEFMTFDGLRITTVPSECLMAMKLMSSRFGEKDADDICFLLKEINISNVDEAYTVLESFYPSDRILPKTVYVLEDCLRRNKEE